MTSTTMATKVAGVHGGISRDKNTRRIWVPPSEFRALTVTGVWALAASSNVVSFATADVGGAGELLYVPMAVELSDFAQRGSAVDRGVSVIGLEVIYEVLVSALADIDGLLYKTTFDAEGVGTATLVTTTQTLDVVTDTGREVDQHRMSLVIAENDRFFLDGGTVMHGILDLDDGTASDVNILGGFWHIRRVEE